MNKNKKQKSLALLMVAATLILVLFLSGCSKAESEKTLAVVNGTEITEAQFNQRYNIISGQYNFDLNNKDHQAYQKELKEQVLNSLVDEEVLLQEAKKQELTVSEEELNSEITMFKSNFSSEEEFKSYLTEGMKLTEEEFKTVLQNELTISKLYAEVTKDVKSSSLSPKEYFESNQDVFMQGEEVSATHVLLKTEEEAKKVIEDIKAGGDMNQIAKEKSIDESAQVNGGELGYFAKGRMVEEFDKAVFSMKVGELLAEPVKSQFGYHVIRLNDKKEAKEVKFSEVEGDITSYLIEEEKNIVFMEYINELRAASTIEMK